MYLLFWEDALESYPVNKYLLSGYNCSRTVLGTAGSTKGVNTWPLPTGCTQRYCRSKTDLCSCLTASLCGTEIKCIISDKGKYHQRRLYKIKS